MGILAGRAPRERQCTLEGEAQYVNVWGSVYWEGVYNVVKCILRVQIFFNWLLKLTN